MKRSYLASALATALIVPAAAHAQTPAPTAPASSSAAASLTVGAKVFDPQGAEVGTIESVSGGNVVINTGTNRATLASNSFGTSAKGPTLNTTRAELDQAVVAASAQANTATKAALVAGAEVRGKAGEVVGKVKEIQGDNVVLDRDAGPVALTSQYFTTDANGLVLTMTAAELDAAAKAAGAAASTTATAATTTAPAENAAE